jgi:hypothetical protein
VVVSEGDMVVFEDVNDCFLSWIDLHLIIMYLHLIMKYLYLVVVQCGCYLVAISLVRSVVH